MASDPDSVETSPFEPTEHHRRLASMVGSWRGVAKLWLDPAAPPAETPIAATAVALLGGRFVRLTYHGTAMDKPHAGEMLFAYERDEKRHSLAWIDSFHTGTALMLSTGPAGTDGAFDVLGSYAAGDERWGWRTVLRADPERVVITAFNIDPGGREYPAIETTLVRA